MSSFLEAAKAASLEGPHEHECPSCGRKWKHEEPRCKTGPVRVCPTLDCLDKFLRERHNVDTSEGLKASDLVKFGQFMESKGF